MLTETAKTIHANCVSVDGKGLLILGASGAGKSSLTFELIALGAMLVSDDRTRLYMDGVELHAQAPASIRGMIEARGIGILSAPSIPNELVSAVVDLDRVEKHRLPSPRSVFILGQSIPCLYKVQSPSFSSMLLHYLRYGMQSGV